MDTIWLFLGRLHPLAVHLPIGILLVLALVELVGRFPRAPRLPEGVRTLLLICGALSALASAAFGWLLARDGGYDPTLLARHRNLGFITAGLSLVLLVAQGLRWRRFYGATFFATLGALTLAGHYGGSLTHGENYLAFRAPAETAPAAAVNDPAKAVAFHAVIQPILEQRCVSCHGPSKSNGDLRLDTYAELLKGGKTGQSLKPGSAASSELVKRVYLPLEAKKHMPPKGKPQLTDDELAVLEWWIDRGASAEQTVLALAPPPAIAQALAPRFPGLVPAPPDRAATVAAAAALEKKTGLLIRPLSASTPWLAVNARLLGKSVTDAQVAELAAIAPAVYTLDLGETSVTDAALATVGRMTQLRTLHLDRTQVTDAGLAQLAPLTQLHTLNLHATAITDQGLIALQPLGRLRSIFLWQTQATAAGADALGAHVMDRRSLRRWQDNLLDLQRRIQAEEFKADLGAPVAPAPSPTPAPKTASVETKPNPAAPSLD